MVGPDSLRTTRALSLLVPVLSLLLGLATLTSANAAPTASGKITGTVSDPSGRPLKGVSVSAFNNSTFEYAETGASGRYVITGLPAGSYTVEFSDDNRTFQGEYYDNASEQSEATPVAVTSTGTRSGVDARLTRAARISGTVTDAAGHPLEGIGVSADPADPTARGGGGASTDENGDYTVRGLVPGDYRLSFRDYDDVYDGEYYDNAQARSDAILVVVATSAVLTGYDASLELQMPYSPIVDAGPATSCGECGGEYLYANPDYVDFLTNAVTWEFRAFPSNAQNTYRINSTPALPANAGSVWHYGEEGQASVRTANLIDATTYKIRIEEVSAAGVVLSTSEELTYSPEKVESPTRLEIHDSTGHVMDVFAPAEETFTAGETYTLHWTGGWAPDAVYWNALNAFDPGITLVEGGKETSAWTEVTIPADLAGDKVLVEFAVGAPGKLTTWYATDRVPVLSADGQTPLHLTAAVAEGTASVGKTLTLAGATSSADPDRVISWLSNGAPVAGATGETYRLRQADAGMRIAVNVTASKEQYATSSVTSAAVAVGAFNVRKPTVKGTAKVGQKLTAIKGRWTAPRYGFSYVWLRNGKPIKHATKGTYITTRADQGKKISVEEVAQRSGFPTVRATSSAKKVR